MSEDPRAFVAGVFDRASATYDAVGVDFYGHIAEFLVNEVGLQPGERVLDVGCGRGAVLFRAAPIVGPTGRVTGIDLAPGMVAATAQEIAGRGLRNVDVHLDDAQEPDLADASYDVILASLSLFFLPRPPEALARYHRALMPGGRFGCTTFAGDDARWAWFEEGRTTFMAGHDFRAPGADSFASDDSISTLLKTTGFSDVTHVKHQFDVRFESREHWWRWTWSQSLRGTWEQLSEETMAQARAFIDENLERIAEPDGSLIYRQPVRVTTAASA